MSGTCFECKFMRQRTGIEPCEHCTNIFAMTGTHPNFEQRKPLTNADRIRAMNDEELADEILSWFNWLNAVEWNDKRILDWLRQEVSDAL